MTLRFNAFDDRRGSAPCEQRQLLRAVIDALADPQILFEPVRNRSGAIIDFLYWEANPATCDYLGVRHDDLIGRSLVKTFPDIEESGLLAHYVHCADTGESVFLADFVFCDPVLGTTLRYEIRANRLQGGLLSVNYRDVTDRHEANRRLAESEERYRLLAVNISDVAVHIRDGVIAWVSPSAEGPTGAPPQHWLGRPVHDLIPADDAAVMAGLVEQNATAATAARRLRMIDARGDAHWAEIRATTFHDARGNPDGWMAFLRVVDAEVMAEEALAHAQRRQAESDALYRRAVESAAVGTCLARPDGTFLEVNGALCEFFGYDATTLLTKTWIDLTAEEYLTTDQDSISALVDGRIDSYRTTIQYIHADGHPIWGDLSVGCVRKPDGSIETYIAQVADITAQVQAREQLEEARRLLAASADSMLDPQVLFEAVRDPDGHVVDFHFVAANRATFLYLRVSEEDLLGSSALQNLPNLEGSGLLARYAQCLKDGQPVILFDFFYFNEMLDDARRYDIRATRAGPDLLSLSWTDVTDRFQSAQLLASSEEKYRLLAENAGDVVTHVRDGRFVWASPSVENVLGAPAEYWVGRDVREIIPPEDYPALAERTAILDAGGTVRGRIRVKSLDGTVHWIDVHSKPFYDAEGHQDGSTGSLRVIDDEVAAQQETDEARRQRARADALYRRLVDNAGVGMCLINPEGGFVEVNNALCEFFGYDATALKQKTWQELTAPAFLAADQSKAEEVLQGRLDSYRMIKQYIHADGHLIWGDLSVSCLRKADGDVEYFISQIIDITEQVEARELLDIRDKENQVLAEQLTSEMRSAAKYVVSTLPGELHGPVEASSCYLPSLEVGGDSFHYRWIDDDLLKIYLIDVSGHGVRPALQSMSVHNLVRLGSLPVATLLRPDRVLTRLNNLFRMDDQDSNYFTVWYGIYEASTRTLRYASAGHPPVLAFNASPDGWDTTPLRTDSPPIGMFDDATFRTGTYRVPVGCRMLLFSDGAFEFPMADGRQWSLSGFTELARRLAASADFSAGALAEQLQDRTANGVFDDDCSLIALTFN